MASPRFLTLQEVISPERINCSESTLRRIMAHTDFPKPFRLAGSRAVRFLADDVDRWMREKAAASADTTGEVRRNPAGLIEQPGGGE